MSEESVFDQAAGKRPRRVWTHNMVGDNAGVESGTLLLTPVPGRKPGAE